MMIKMKFILTIVVYNPTEEIFAKINNYDEYGLFEKVLVYDNSATSSQNRFNEEILYLFNGLNEGLSVAYNTGIRYSLENGCDYVCFLDQDSLFEKEQIYKMQQYIIDNKVLMDDIALIGPWWDKNKQLVNEEELIDKKYIINSGTFLNLDVVREHNVFYDENIFIDGVDYDYCWTMHDIGKRVCILPSVKMLHQVGEGEKGQKFLYHSAERYYYIAYAKRYIWNKHKGLFGRFLAQVSNARLILIILINEQDKKKKALGCIKGMYTKIR